MGSLDDAGLRRMRSLVTHKKLKEIALAQADEVRVLAAELETLRARTYPTFVEPAPCSFALPADTRLTLRRQGGRLGRSAPNPLPPYGLSLP